MQCKSLWIKASAKCINVNVNVNDLPHKVVSQKHLFVALSIFDLVS